MNHLAVRVQDVWILFNIAAALVLAGDFILNEIRAARELAAERRRHPAAPASRPR